MSILALSGVFAGAASSPGCGADRDAARSARDGAAALSPPAARGPAAPPIGDVRGEGQRGAGGEVRGVTDGEVVLGMVGPMSGPAKDLGTRMKVGIETAINVVNDADGVNGRRLRLVAYDDGYDPSRTLRAMKQLFSKDRVLGIIGNVGTPTAVVSLPYALEHQLLFFGAFTGASLVRRHPPDRYVFNLRASYAEETEAVARYLVRVRGLRPEQLAVFAQDDTFGDDAYAGVTSALRNLGMDPGAVARVGYARNTDDVTAAIAQLRAKRLRAVIMAATYRAGARLIGGLSDLHPGLIFTNVSFVGSTALAEELRMLAPAACAEVIVTEVMPPMASQAPAVVEYKAALAKYFPGIAVDSVSLEGYVTTGALIEALRRTGRDLDVKRLVNQLETMNRFELGLGAPVGFTPSQHQASHKVWGTRLDRAGRYETIDLE